MKLASFNDGTLDGKLIIVSKDSDTFSLYKESMIKPYFLNGNGFLTFIFMEQISLAMSKF